ncbi:MAG TPA: hypothetical protein VER03_09750 [Bryobacteraceae bacterium]|nr:hypothetical protein [Bryobacteraceae bacterium]
MSWMDQLGGMLQQYANSGQASQTTEDDFDRASQMAPREALSGGLSEAFRSQQTPPFPNMLSQMFGSSNGMQRANLLNTLLSVAGPALLSNVLSRGGGMGNLAGMLQGGQVTPQQAEQIPPEAVEELAREAERRDPSVIDRVSDFYAEHPTLVKTLGAAALAVAMSGMTKQKRGLF